MIALCLCLDSRIENVSQDVFFDTELVLQSLCFIFVFQPDDSARKVEVVSWLFLVQLEADETAPK